MKNKKRFTENEQPDYIEVEQALLGALMIEDDAMDKIKYCMKPEFFISDSHNVIFSAVAELSENKYPIDIFTVTTKLRECNQLEKQEVLTILLSLLIMLHPLPIWNTGPGLF
jgi:replicative DNA helicase